MIWAKTAMNEGDVLYKYHQARFNTNKNVLGVILGPTGSGKSYTALRICEIDYKKRFNKPFPIENVTFSIGETIKRIQEIQKSGRKGELIMPDDIGAAGYGALEFQSKTSKMFSYILQAFRSLNIGLMMTLPVLTMLNKSGRQLIHYQLVTDGIDYELKMSRVKPYFHQLNQSSGKSYWKYPKVSVAGHVRTVKRLWYGLPSKELRDAYEDKKAKFLAKMTHDFTNEIDVIENGNKKVRVPTQQMIEAWVLDQSGMRQRFIAEKFDVSQQTISQWKEIVQNYVKSSKTTQNPLGKRALQAEITP